VRKFIIIIIGRISILLGFIKLSLSQPMGFTFCPFLLPIPMGEKGRGERAAVWPWLPAAGLNHDINTSGELSGMLPYCQQ